MKKAASNPGGKGHVFEPESPGSKWCATCGHHGSVTRHATDEELGRSPRATNVSNFRQIADEYLPRSGVERSPRPEIRQHAEFDAGSNHNDLIRGQGY